jgi:two-component system, OmpR family, sensor histidine kinase KdpD
MRLGRVLHSVAATAAAVAATFIAWRLQLNLASASVLNVLLVVIVARAFGFVVATIASVAAVACMNFLLIPPLFSFTVADTRNWVALGAFEACALLVSRLSTQAEQQAMLARRERADSRRLYEVSRQMLLFDRQRPPGPQIVELLQRVFEPEAVVLFDPELVRVDTPGMPRDEVADGARRAFLEGRDSFDAATRTWYRVVRLGQRPKGALGLKGPELTGVLADALASLAAIGLERARAIEAESRAVAERHTEQLRTAVLDALAHEFKTPLTTIMTASGGLLEMNRLTPEQHELVTLIDDEGVRLDELTTRLLRTAKLDSSDVVLRRTPAELGEVVTQLLASVDQRRAEHAIVTRVSDESAQVLADRDLLTMALSQLLDNAIRYSTPGSPITVGASAQPEAVRISVRNLGAGIPPVERSKIFERYYRMPGSSHRPNGTGLGLSVARKIVEAHGGRVWVEGEEGETTFIVTLPRTESRKA